MTATATAAPPEPAFAYGGTYRRTPPEDTWRRLRPHLRAAGITRVSDVTMLDDIGVPVWQAVRPDSANLTVSQGKGVTPVLAKVSAAMEAFELHCAQSPALERRRATVGEMRPDLGRLLDGLPLLDQHSVHGNTPLDWTPVDDLLEPGRTRWWPSEAVSVDFRVRTRWQPPVVRVNSNGLAGGNTLTEATLHALLEVVERHSMAEARAAGPVWGCAVRLLPGAQGPAAEVTARIRAAAGVVEAVDVTGGLGVPTFMARVWSPSMPHWFSGSGSHLDASTALSRALTEAVQSRVTAIAGARDDIAPMALDFAAPPPQGAGLGETTTDTLLRRAPHGPSSPRARDARQDLDDLLNRCREAGVGVLRADLTRPEYGIPVVRVAAPGLRFAERHGHG